MSTRRFTVFRHVLDHLSHRQRRKPGPWPNASVLLGLAAALMAIWFLAYGAQRIMQAPNPPAPASGNLETGASK